MDEKTYVSRLIRSLDEFPFFEVEKLCEALRSCWYNGRTVYICGNGGSAGNAIHLANDFIYGAGLRAGRGLAIESLAANPAVLTCLGNDLGYEYIFSEQIRVKCKEGDLLILLSGSGNSPNIVRAAEIAKEKGVLTCGIVGFDGGSVAKLADIVIHIAECDMQVAEDFQLIIGHYCMKWLYSNLDREVSR